MPQMPQIPNMADILAMMTNMMGQCLRHNGPHGHFSGLSVLTAARWQPGVLSQSRISIWVALSGGPPKGQKKNSSKPPDLTR